MITRFAKAGAFIVGISTVLALLVAIIQLSQSVNQAESESSAQATLVVVLQEQLQIHRELATLESSGLANGMTVTVIYKQLEHLNSTESSLQTQQSNLGFATSSNTKMMGTTMFPTTILSATANQFTKTPIPTKSRTPLPTWTLSPIPPPATYTPSKTLSPTLTHTPTIEALIGGIVLCRDTNYQGEKEIFSYISNNTCLQIIPLYKQVSSFYFDGDYIGRFDVIFYNDTTCSVYLARYGSAAPELEGLNDTFGSIRIEAH